MINANTSLSTTTAFIATFDNIKKENPFIDLTKRSNLKKITLYKNILLKTLPVQISR
ncbi:MAG: hypothetical protein RIR11_1626 [Bacteroidota bacterium]|jgi:hypothetical protein